MSDNDREPRVWIGALSAYNSGHLHGDWIPATDEGELWSGIRKVLASSPEADEEEFGVFDYEGFQGIPINEHETVANVVKIAQAVRQHGAAFSVWYSYHGDLEIAIESFEDAFIGCFDSEDDLGQHLLDELGIEDELEKLANTLFHALATYVKFDVEQWLHDMTCEGSIYLAETPEGIYGFWVS